MFASQWVVVFAGANHEWPVVVVHAEEHRHPMVVLVSSWTAEEKQTSGVVVVGQERQCRWGWETIASFERGIAEPLRS
jgi:hypothetical protein